MTSHDDTVSLETKIALMISKLEALTKDCDKVAAKINNDLVSRELLQVTNQRISALEKENAAQKETQNWLIRGIFIAMLSFLASVGMFVLNNMQG